MFTHIMISLHAFSPHIIVTPNEIVEYTFRHCLFFHAYDLCDKNVNVQTLIKIVENGVNNVAL